LFYRTPAGNEPVREWLKELSRDDRLAIGQDLQHLQYRWPVGMPLARPLTNGLAEVRTNLAGNRTARVLFFVEHERIGVVSCTALSRRRGRRRRPILTLRSGA
jgi:phage-related protein